MPALLQPFCSVVADKSHEVVDGAVEAEFADVEGYVIVSCVIPLTPSEGLGVKFTGVVVVHNHEFGVVGRYAVFFDDSPDAFLLRAVYEDFEGVGMVFENVESTPSDDDARLLFCNLFDDRRLGLKQLMRSELWSEVMVGVVDHV